MDPGRVPGEMLEEQRCLRRSRADVLAAMVPQIGDIGLHDRHVVHLDGQLPCLLAGALFAGAVVDGLLLGHWHLVDRKLSRDHLGRINRFFLAGTVLASAAVLLGGTGGGEARSDFSPLLGVGVLTVSLAVGLAVLCAVMALFIRALIKENSLQAATGFFYLAVILAFASEFAAKVRFF